MSDQIIEMPAAVKNMITGQPQKPTQQEAASQMRDDIVGAINAGASNGVTMFECAAILSTIWFQVQADNLEACRRQKSKDNGR